MAAFVFLAASLLLGGCGDGGAGAGVDADATAAPAKVYKWKLVTTWPKNYPGLGYGPENFAKMVERMSNGRLIVRVYGGNELVPPFEVFDAVSRGTAEMGHAGSYYWKGKSPAAPFFTAVPFGMTAQETNAWLYHGGGMALWRELYEPFNLIPLAGGNSGTQMAGWFRREINSVADLQGLKMRIPGMGGEVLSRLGVTAVSMPGSEIYTSMQTGVIDATEWVAPYNDMALGLHEVAKFCYYPGWHEPGATLEFTVNRDAWNSLPEDLQAIVETAARAVNTEMLDEYTAGNAAALKQLVEQHGVQMRPLPPDVLKAIHKASLEVLQETAAQDEMARRIHESYWNFRRDVMDYHSIGEQAFLEARTMVENQD
jgi:TRAP-type mannitol/chloroaromatic compound transport system substrate-binding protein